MAAKKGAISHIPTQAGSDSAISKFSGTILEVLSNLPSSTEPRSATPLERAKRIGGAAAIKSAKISGTLALPPGPFGMLTIIPDLIVIWRVQSQMVADIAACFSKTAYLTREQMIYCLFRHAGSQAVRDLVVRVGERVLVRRASLRVIQNILRRIGITVTQRLAGRTISRWLPIIGAVGVGAYAYYDTACVAKTATDFFQGAMPLRAVSGKACRVRAIGGTRRCYTAKRRFAAKHERRSSQPTRSALAGGSVALTASRSGSRSRGRS